MKTSRRWRLTVALAALGLIVSFSAMSQEGFDLEGWGWEAPLHSEVDATAFVRFELTPDVVQDSQRSLADLRVIDSGGKLVPHVIHRQRPTAGTGS